jgi:hypothetical protein
VVELLAARGANVSVRNQRGLTPLAVLLRNPSPERQPTVDLLKKLGAKE